MSLMRRLLNPWLRAVEKRRIRKGDPHDLRLALERQSRLFFHAPRGTQLKWLKHGEVECLEITGRAVKPARVLFYIHGGGFVFGSPNTHSAMVANLAQRLGAMAVLPRYRLAPEFPYPAAPEDVRAAWDGLISSGINPSDVVLGGDSAGGALAFGLVADLCAQGAPRPGAVFAFSPVCDLTYSGESFSENAVCDVVLPVESASTLQQMYLRGHAPDDPAVSPLFANFEGAPPAWVTAGDTEILLDDARRLVAHMAGQGVQAELHIEHDLPHVWPIFHNILPEGRATLAALARWIRQQQGWASES